MVAAGIICEYNPFHKGHRYHIEKVREMTGAALIVAVMNGDFVQRGEPAVVDKYTRAHMALAEGADIVFELPVRYGLSSAEDFAYGGILLLESLGFVETYCFGSEKTKKNLLENAGHFFADEPQQYKNNLDALLRRGMSYPLARQQAYCEITGMEKDEAAVLFSPNNTLAIEYMKAAEHINSKMRPVVIERHGMGYNDILAGGDDEFLSASAIRKNLLEDNCDGIPQKALDIFLNAPCRMETEDFWEICAYAIRSKWDELEQFKDMTPELANVYRENFYKAVSFEDFVSRCKSKNITMARIKRCVYQILLDIKNEPRESVMPYARILGMKKEAASYLGKTREMVLIGRLAKDREQLSETAGRKLEQDIFSSDVYRMVSMKKCGQYIADEYKRKIIRI